MCKCSFWLTKHTKFGMISARSLKFHLNIFAQLIQPIYDKLCITNSAFYNTISKLHKLFYTQKSILKISHRKNIDF